MKILTLTAIDSPEEQLYSSAETEPSLWEEKVITEKILSFTTAPVSWYHKTTYPITKVTFIGGWTQHYKISAAALEEMLT